MKGRTVEIIKGGDKGKRAVIVSVHGSVLRVRVEGAYTEVPITWVKFL